MSDLYPLDVLRLAASITRTERLAAPDGSAEKVSRVCGSSVIVDVALDPAGGLAALAVTPKACALGQASAAVLALHGLGAGRDAIEQARDALRAMLKEGAPPPTGRFGDLAKLEAARDYPARHASIMLAWNAALAAMDAALAARTDTPRHAETPGDLAR